MAANQIELQLADLVGGNAYVGELAEAGVDAISRRAGRDDAINNRAGGAHALRGGGCESDVNALRRDGVKLRES